MFELGNEIYELRYDLKRVEMLESGTGMTIVDIIQSVPSIARMKMLLGVALFNSAGNPVSTQRGTEIATDIIQKYGLLESFTKAINKVSEDCAFLFQ